MDKPIKIQHQLLVDLLPGLSGRGMDYSSSILRKHSDTQNKMHRANHFFFVSADTKTEQQRAPVEVVVCGTVMAEGTKSEQMGPGWSLAPLEELGWLGSSTTLPGCGLPIEDTGLVTTVVFS